MDWNIVYLDFPASTHNRICRLLYRKGLGRIFGLMEEDKTELIPVDSLADSVVHDVSYHEIYNPPKHSDPDIKELAIGSVLVSGSTLKSSGINKNIHCLVHNSFYIYGKDIENYYFSIIKVKNDEELERELKKHKTQVALCQDSYKLLIIFSIMSSNQWRLAGLNQEGVFQNIELNQEDDTELISRLNNQSDDKSETIDEIRKFIELLLLKFNLTINCYPSLFHWQPTISIEEGEPKQKRIGKTSEIAPKGWLSIEIPRYDAKNEPVGDRSPEESYEDWQSSSPILVKLGHWCYEGHHDLITINIPDAVEDAFARKKPLANFLVCNILAFLGVEESQLKNTFYKYDISDPGILIYRSHSSSERILNNVLNCISSREVREDVMNRVFPILPLRKRFGGSTLLIPPRLQKEIKESSYKKNIMIFDDASISGRTLQDLRTSLIHLGASV